MGKLNEKIAPEYERLLKEHILKENVASPISIKTDGEIILGTQDIANWKYTDQQGNPISPYETRIFEELVGKFNKYNTLGIGKLYKTAELGTFAAYSVSSDMENPNDSEDYTYLSLPIYNKKDMGRPVPKTIAHEIGGHGVDHQISRDTLKVWQIIKSLHDSNKRVLLQIRI